MKHLWFKIVRYYVYLGLQAYFKKIEVVHQEIIPKDKAFLFVGNHRNGLMDPILVATTQRDTIFHFLTRASAFKNPIADFLLRSINMLPIYRIRDGKDSIQRNQEIFEACYRIFNQEESVLMFPEGNHGLPRRLRPLSKGFTRIAFGYLDRNPTKELYIIPVGLNYTNILKVGSSVSVYYGKALLANTYYQPTDEKAGIENLKNAINSRLKELTTHIESVENHSRIEKTLINKGIDFLNPIKANKLINEITNLDDSLLQKQEKTGLLKRVISILFKINTFFPILIWKAIKPKIKDVVLTATFRFGLSLALIPLTYTIQAIIVGILSNIYYGMGYFIISILILWGYKNNQTTESVTTLPS